MTAVAAHQSVAAHQVVERLRGQGQPQRQVERHPRGPRHLRLRPLRWRGAWLGVRRRLRLGLQRELESRIAIRQVGKGVRRRCRWCSRGAGGGWRWLFRRCLVLLGGGGHLVTPAQRASPAARHGRVPPTNWRAAAGAGVCMRRQPCRGSKGKNIRGAQGPLRCGPGARQWRLCLGFRVQGGAPAAGAGSPATSPGPAAARRHAGGAARARARGRRCWRCPPRGTPPPPPAAAPRPPCAPPAPRQHTPRLPWGGLGPGLRPPAPHHPRPSGQPPPRWAAVLPCPVVLLAC